MTSDSSQTLSGPQFYHLERDVCTVPGDPTKMVDLRKMGSSLEDLPRGPHFSAAHHLPETPNPTRSSSHSVDGFFAPSLSGWVTPPVHRADFLLQWGKEERAESSCLTPASCRKGGATSPPAEDLPAAPNPPTGLGGGRGAGALGTLAGERGTLAWRQSLGPGGHTGAGGAWGGRGPRRRQRACVYAWVASLGSGVS